MRRFTILALAVAIGLGTAFSPFASGAPGRARARSPSEQGFADRGRLAPAQEQRPVPATRSPACDDARLAKGSPASPAPRRVPARRRPSRAVRRQAARAHEARVLPRAGVGRARGRSRRARVHRLDARAKLLGLAGLTVVAATSPPAAWPLLACCAALLARSRSPPACPRAVLWSRALVILPLVVLAAASLPFVRHGGAELPARAAARLRGRPGGVRRGGRQGGASGRSARSCSPRRRACPARSRGCGGCTRRRVLVAIAGVTWRYVFVLAGEVGRMRTALAARGHRPRHLLHGAATGRLATALFLRAHARGERVHVAMAARGWRGVPPAPARAPRCAAPTSPSSPRSPASRSSLRVLLEVSA